MTELELEYGPMTREEKLELAKEFERLALILRNDLAKRAVHSIRRRKQKSENPRFKWTPESNN